MLLVPSTDGRPWIYFSVPAFTLEFHTTACLDGCPGHTSHKTYSKRYSLFSPKMSTSSVFPATKHPVPIVSDFFFFFPITHSIHRQILLVLLSKYQPLGPFSLSVTTTHVPAWITKPASYLVFPCLLLPFTIWVLHSGSSDFLRTDVISSVPVASHCTWLMDSLWAGLVDLSAVIPDCSPLPSLILATLTFLRSTHPCSFPP